MIIIPKNKKHTSISFQYANVLKNIDYILFIENPYDYLPAIAWTTALFAALRTMGCGENASFGIRVISA